MVETRGAQGKAEKDGGDGGDRGAYGWSFSQGFSSMLEVGAGWLSKSRALRLGTFEVSEVVLGEGGYGRVLKGVDKATGVDVAVKEIDVTKMRPASIIREVAMFRRLGEHPNIIQLKGYFETEEKHYIVMEAVTGGELFKQVGPHIASKTAGRWYTGELVHG